LLTVPGAGEVKAVPLRTNQRCEPTNKFFLVQLIVSSFFCFCLRAEYRDSGEAYVIRNHSLVEGN
jgi:hypothetical protein